MCNCVTKFGTGHRALMLYGREGITYDGTYGCHCSVWKQDDLKSYGWIFVKFGEYVDAFSSLPFIFLFDGCCVFLIFRQISTSVWRGRQCVEPIRSVETRSGHTLVITSLRAVLDTGSTTKEAAVKVNVDALCIDEPQGFSAQWLNVALGLWKLDFFDPSVFVCMILHYGLTTQSVFFTDLNHVIPNVLKLFLATPNIVVSQECCWIWGSPVLIQWFSIIM